jgi:hypothetical protein
MTVAKKDLTDNLVDHLDLSQRDGKCLVEAFFNQIRAALAKGEDVNLSGFGNSSPFGINDIGPGAIQGPERRSRSRRGAW